MHFVKPGTVVRWHRRLSLLLAASLAAASIDTRDGDELFAGAPGADNGAGRVYMFSLGAPPKTFEPQFPQEGGRLGVGLAPGDLDDDGSLDLIAGAPETTLEGLEFAGRVHIWHSDLSTAFVLDNPSVPDPATWKGFMGVFLATADGNGDGVMDLYIAVPGTAPPGASSSRAARRSWSSETPGTPATPGAWPSWPTCCWRTGPEQP